MASGSFNTLDSKGLDPSTLSNLFAGPIRFASLGEMLPLLGKSEQHDDISTRSGLSGARAAVTAIGLEAGTALLLFALWRVWHLFR